MSDADLIVQRPPRGASQLFLLFHGVGESPLMMRAFGLRLARAFPDSLIVSVAAPQRCGRGRQWFSAQDISDESRILRVGAAMPGFIDGVRRWQKDADVSIAATALVGFSQGAIMALEALKAEPDLAGRVIAVGGRFAELPTESFRYATVHLVHGGADAVIPSAHALQAAERLMAIGSDVTADVLPQLGHTMDAALMEIAIERLRNHVPQWMWREALRADRGEGGDQRALRAKPGQLH